MGSKTLRIQEQGDIDKLRESLNFLALVIDKRALNEAVNTLVEGKKLSAEEHAKAEETRENIADYEALIAKSKAEQEKLQKIHDAIKADKEAAEVIWQQNNAHLVTLEERKKAAETAEKSLRAAKQEHEDREAAIAEKEQAQESRDIAQEERNKKLNEREHELNERDALVLNAIKRKK